MSEEQKIQTKSFQYGNECESSWPPQFGNGKPGIFYRDKETGEFKEGYPPDPNPKHDTAPYVISDTTTPYFHPAAEKWTDSKSAIRRFDEVTGSITTDKKLPPNESVARENRRNRRQDIHKALHRAVAQIDAGTAPLSEETRQLCERENERVSQRLNFDAFNVAGRKSNAKGKKYRRR